MMAEKRVRSNAKSSFTRAVTELNKSIDQTDSIDVITLLYSDLEQKFNI